MAASTLGPKDYIHTRILLYGIEYRVYGVLLMVFKHEDPTKHDFWTPPCLGLSDQTVASLVSLAPIDEVHQVSELAGKVWARRVLSLRNI